MVFEWSEELKAKQNPSSSHRSILLQKQNTARQGADLKGLGGRQTFCYFADRCLPVTIFHFISSTAQNRLQIPLRGKQNTAKRLRMEPGSSRNTAFPSGSTGPSPSAELLPQLLPPEPCTPCIAALPPMSLSSVPVPAPVLVPAPVPVIVPVPVPAWKHR